MPDVKRTFDRIIYAARPGQDGLLSTDLQINQALHRIKRAAEEGLRRHEGGSNA